MLRHMVDLARTPAEKREKLEDMMACPPDAADMPTYPWGMTIRMDDEVLEKLNIDTDDCEVGDLLHMVVMARVTSISKNADQGGSRENIELQIIMASAEDEDDEEPGEDED
jgi:hypothetical protein